MQFNCINLNVELPFVGKSVTRCDESFHKKKRGYGAVFGISQEFRLCVELTHLGRVMHICVSNLTIIGLDNGLSPGRRQAIIWTNAWILLIGPLGTNFSEILIIILTSLF